jgi:hypothetical protein
VEFRFYIDPETDEPHIHRHAVEETEVREILDRPWEDRPGQDDSRVALGQTRAGRYLRVVYVPDAADRSIFVITAYEPGRKVVQALRRRRRRKR